MAIVKGKDVIVRKGKVFRSIVAWTGGPLPLEFSKARPSTGILTLECISLIPKSLHSPAAPSESQSPEDHDDHPRLTPPLLSLLSNPNQDDELAAMKENQNLMMRKIFGLEIECADLRKELTKISSDKGDCDDATLGNGVSHQEETSEDAQWLFNSDDLPLDKKESDHDEEMPQNEVAENNPNAQHRSDVANNTSEPIAKVWEFFFHNLP